MTLKKLSAVAALALAGAFTTGAALAEEVTLTACTKDGRTATLLVDVTGSLRSGITIEELARDAFTKTARELNSDALLKGETVFSYYMSEATKGKKAFPHSGCVWLEITVGSPACTPQ